MIRKNTTTKKHRDSNPSRGNKTHLIFLDQSHGSRFVENHTAKNNFNLSGPVDVRDSQPMPFDQNLFQRNQIVIAQDTNKSQQLVPDTNSTLAYTGQRNETSSKPNR